MFIHPRSIHDGSIARRRRSHRLMLGMAVGVAIAAALPSANAQGTRAHPDIQGCFEYVREVQPMITGADTALSWTGPCRDGLRDGPGLLRVYRGLELLVSSSGRYQNGFRIGYWSWEFPDGRRLEARFAGDGRDPLERVLESSKGERSRQIWQDGAYVADAGIAPPPEPRPLEPAVAAWPVSTQRTGRFDASSYAAAHFRTANCARAQRVEPRSDFLATRRDVDLFVRVGEGALRAEIDAELRSWTRAMHSAALRAAAQTGGVSANRTSIAVDRANVAAADDVALRARYEWVRCHEANGLPFLARMQQSAPACERVSLIKLDTVRASGNPRLQAEFADCLHAEIHAPRWAR